MDAQKDVPPQVTRCIDTIVRGVVKAHNRAARSAGAHWALPEVAGAPASNRTICGIRLACLGHLSANIGDQMFQLNIENNFENWNAFISYTKDTANVCLTMAMAAVGMSTNLAELRSMGYKPFIVGFIAALVVGLVSIITMQSFEKIILLL